ncbi:MAG: GxxExxY protein [Chloroflexi bacterium]|nr:GxxExxY protein [Chloroflexota bacterium]
MEKNPGHLKHAELTEKVIKIFYQVYNELGFGFLESVCENAMAIALIEAGIRVRQQVPIPVYFRGQQVGDFRCDLLVEDKVILELKAVKAITPEHHAQALNYLRATEVEVALILNFGERPDFKRLVFDNDRKRLSRVANTST